MRIRLCILTALLLASGGVNAAEVFDVLEVNGHPGYITAYQVSPDGIVDKVLMLVSGFDTDNDDHPIDDLTTDYQPVIDLLGPQGWDIVLFDYVRGDIDLKQNADNLARFIEVVDSVAVPNYHLALVGGSMGGLSYGPCLSRSTPGWASTRSFPWTPASRRLPEQLGGRPGHADA